LNTPVIVAYDISDDRLRSLFAKELLYFGTRTQKSVFEAWVSEGDLERLKRIVDDYASHRDSSVNLYILTVKQHKHIVRIGPDDSLSIEDFIL
jgi:CRISPR-associated endonuclease Cas2